MMKNYKMEIVEKLRGTIQVQAEDEAQAYYIAKQLLFENGCDRLSCPVSGVDEDLYEYEGDLISITQSVEDCKEIKSDKGFPVGNDVDFGTSME